MISRPKDSVVGAAGAQDTQICGRQNSEHRRGAASAVHILWGAPGIFRIPILRAVRWHRLGNFENHAMATANAAAGIVSNLNSCSAGIRGSPLQRGADVQVLKQPVRTPVRVQAKKGEEEKEPEKEKEKEKTKTSLFTSITDALDFAQARSEKDAELLEDARTATKMGEKMSREQYGALRRKIGGTYKDFFKDSIDVVGDYVEDGWVDKRCRYCKKDTSTEPRTVDSMGRYAHVACMENAKSGNFFSRLFGK